MTFTEGDLATLIWKACTDAGHPITVPASRDAARAALTVCDPPPPLTGWPVLMVDLHERTTWAAWHQPGLLATALRHYADRLDHTAHQAAIAATTEQDRTAA